MGWRADLAFSRPTAHRVLSQVIAAAKHVVVRGASSLLGLEPTAGNLELSFFVE
jgi:hypothetical protein